MDILIFLCWYGSAISNNGMQKEKYE